METNEFDNGIPAWLKWAIIIIGGLWLAAIMFGCTTERKAVSYMNGHVFVAAKYCANAFPVKDSIIYKAGQIITKSDTTYVQGDSIACPPSDHFAEAGKMVYVKCPPSKIIRDSLFKTDTVSVIRENTAKTTALTSQLAITTDKQKDAEKGRRKWREWALITWAVIAVGGGGYLLAKFKMFI